MENIEDFVQLVETQYDRHQRFKTLKEKIHQQKFIAHNGGLFYVNPELIGFLTVFDDQEIILEDVYGIPICVNRSEFLDTCKQHYQKIMNIWLVEYEQISKSRKSQIV